MSITLRRIDPTRNMQRFYRLDIQPDLFGGVALIKEWGRIGCAGQARSTAYSDQADAFAVFEKQRIAKERRGYRI